MNLMVFPGSAESYYPLKEGMNWEYQFLLTSMLSNIGGQKMIVTNFAPREMKNETVTPQKVDVLGQSSFVYIGKDNNGVFEFAKQLPNAFEPGINKSPQYILKNPINVGISWVVEYETVLLNRNFSIPLNTTIENIDEIVTIPAGTFKNCVRVKYTGRVDRNLGPFKGKARINVESHSWYAPGVGMIKSIIEEKCNHLLVGQGGTISVQLNSYKMQ
jgi:hypothetical protein